MLLLVALPAPAAPRPSAARDADFSSVPYAARSAGHVSVSFTFRHPARRVRLSFGGRDARVERIPGTGRAFAATVGASAGMRDGRSYRATLRWRARGERRSRATRLYVHRRFPGGRG